MTVGLRKNNLTSYERGSFKELWAITWPLALSTISGYLMLLGDRIILAQLSSRAMNASATAGLVFFNINMGIMAALMIAEVFVGQYNGKGEYAKVGSAVWQAIWISIVSTLFFVPLGAYCSHAFIAKGLEDVAAPYLMVLLLFGSIFCINTSLSTFFIGLGKTKYLTKTTLFCTIFNLILDVILVFGVEGIVPAYGVTGAAWGTVIAQFLQLLILFRLFLSQHNKQAYHTNKCSLDLKLCFKLIKIGSPSGLMHVFEIGAYTLMYQFLIYQGDAYITSFVIGQNIFLLFYFICEAFQKAMSAIASNLIGAKEYNLISRLMNSGFKFAFILISAASLVMIFKPEPFINIMLKHNNTGLSVQELLPMIYSALMFFWLACMIDCCVWLYSSILMASGDTNFLMWTSVLTSWLLFVVPGIIFVKYFGFNPSFVWKILPLYPLVCLIIYVKRHKKQPWLKAKVMEEKI